MRIRERFSYWFGGWQIGAAAAQFIVLAWIWGITQPRRRRSVLVRMREWWRDRDLKRNGFEPDVLKPVRRRHQLRRPLASTRLNTQEKSE
jgi:hypothetical protein